ncbi:hypothetical protein M5689_000123 [Euphorbia peplus]|nr:hypothetical protein M5689_000123 [Euphorbia peplus]
MSTTKWLPVICFMLLLAVGSTSAFRPTVCLGECSRFHPDCNKVCIDKGYGNGGACIGMAGPQKCCCVPGSLV